MDFCRLITYFCFLFICFLPLAVAEVRTYSDSECSHILIDSFEDMASKIIRDNFRSNIEAYDCWTRSSVRSNTIGSRINGENVVNIANWILNENLNNNYFAYLRRIGVYTEPNEHYPCQLIPIYKAISGLPLLALGTERGFIGAALSKASQLYLIDYTPDVVVYNYIVYLLLKVSHDRSHYLYLRRNASYAEWMQIFLDKNIEIKLISEQDIYCLWRFWNENVRNRVYPNALKKVFPSTQVENAIETNNTIPIPYSFSQDENSVPIEINAQAFANANYLYDEELFRWVKSLADNDQIYIYLGDISIPDQLTKLINDIYPNKFGIIDLSNTIGIDRLCLLNNSRIKFKSAYLDEVQHAKCFHTLAEASDDNTHIVWTSEIPEVPHPCLKYLKTLQRERGMWVYRSTSLTKILALISGQESSLEIWKSELTDFPGCR